MLISQGWKGAPLTLLALSLAAQESPAPAPAVGGKLPTATVVVSATRTPRALKDTAASVSQSSAEELVERVEVNPQDTASDSATAKLVYRPGGAHTFQLSAGGLRRTTETELLSGVGTVAPGTNVLEQSGADRAQRGQFAFEHAFEDETATLFRKLIWRACFQDAKTGEETVETRTRSRSRYLREGEQRFLQDEYDNANISFTNFVQRYTVLPNPDLKSERSRVRIRGAKFRAVLNLAGGFPFLSSGAYAQGDDLSTGQPLDSVDPLVARAAQPGFHGGISVNYRL